MKKESLEEENARLQEQLERERLEAENMRPEHEIKMNWINQIGEGLCVSIRLRSTPNISSGFRPLACAKALKYLSMTGWKLELQIR